MAIITLTTDWKNSDYYIAAVKARILSIYNDINIVDISHSITQFNSAQAAFVIKNAYKYFPEGTTHIIGVNSVPENDQALIAVESLGQYFLGNDNGVFALIFREEKTRIVKITNQIHGFPDEGSSKGKNEINGLLFPELNILAGTAAFLVKGGNITELGEIQDSYSRQLPIRATFEESSINGSVIYIDSYQNAISNISRDLFTRVGKVFVISQ